LEQKVWSYKLLNSADFAQQELHNLLQKLTLEITSLKKTTNFMFIGIS